MIADVTTFSHDLRNVLSAVVGLAALVVNASRFDRSYEAMAEVYELYS